MTRVYVEVAVAELNGKAGPGAGLEPGSGGSVETQAGATLDPEAARSLRLLADSGLEVVLVTGQAGSPPAALSAIAADAVGVVPARPDSNAWYLTADVERCRGTSARLRTVLIGGAPPVGSVHRCDGVARDLRAAVMEILASEAMPPG